MQVEGLLGSTFFKELESARGAVLGSSEEVRQQQDAALLNTLVHAQQTVSFYGKHVAPFTGETAMAYLQTFPLIDKKTLRDQLADLQSPTHSPSIKLLTSGSSGTQGYVFVNHKELSINRALQILWWEWAGYQLGDPVLQLGFDSKRSFLKRAKDWLLQTDYHYAKELNDEKIAQLLRTYSGKKGVVFFGYAAYLNWFAEVALRENIKEVRFKTVISCGDKLFDAYRERIQLAFGNAVYDTYGASEGFLLAGQRNCGHYHTYPHHVLIEVLDDNGNPVPKNTLGHVYVTGLTTHSMPLIRYKLGDLAALSEFEPCSCGLSTPKITQLVGRDTDIIYGKQGGRFTVQDLVFALKNVAGLEGYQLGYTENGVFILHYWGKELPAIAFQALEIELKNRLKTDLAFSAKFSTHPPPFKGKVQLIKKGGNNA
jgi:phenylacetate-CoA ligase